MEASTRLAGIIVELVILPADIENKKCRVIFDKISDSHGIGQFMSPPDGSIQMSSKKPGPNFTRYIIMRDRVVMSYELCENSMNYYQGLMGDFMGAFTGATGISLFIAQNITVRKLVNIAGIADSRDFLIKKVFSFKEENLQKFGRPLHMLGTRIFFPGSQADPPSFEVKIETLLEDHKTLFIENKAMFPVPMEAQKGLDLGVLINKTDEFINRNIMGFIEQFA